MTAPDSGTCFTLRNYRPGDDAAAYHVCMMTGDHGGNGEPFFREDPDALGRLYVEPYLRFEPDLALLLEDADGVCGYALAARDSKAFYDRYDQEIRPKWMAQFPDPEGDPKDWDRVRETYSLYHHPDHYRWPVHQSQSACQWRSSPHRQLRPADCSTQLSR